MKKQNIILIILILAVQVYSSRFNGFGLKFRTVESEHFKITYHSNCEYLVNRVQQKFEQLYNIYKNTYGLTLPNKTEVVILDSDFSNGWALSFTNTITLWTHDTDFKLRGSHTWWDDVITHEYAHIVSIWTGMKLSNHTPDIRFGFFSHPNENNRIEAFQSLSTEILPFWFTEGIAQYESSRHGSDFWDSHRDMILRTLTLSGKLLTWDHMQVGAGKIDDYEKAYNSGFSLVTYIADTYGYDKITAMLRESAKMHRLNFDRVIKEVLGITGRELYAEWKSSLEKKYKTQVANLGTQVFGRKINKDGFDNYWPMFSPDGKKIFFLSNGKQDYGMQTLYQYQFDDTIKEDKRITPAMNISDIYDIHPQSGRICYQSAKSKKSQLPARQGGARMLDIFTDTLPSDKKSFNPFRKTEKQVTIKKGIFNSSFSPSGNMIACSQRDVDRFYLAITDTSGTYFNVVYPNLQDSVRPEINYIYSIDWSPDGRHIAFSYMDQTDRKIGIYDTLNHTCQTICDTKNDERDPSYSPDGKHLYFSSDRTGIFNIYRYNIQDKSLEQVTNVSGGAFAPSISPDNKKLVYSSYDQNGFGIYLLDSIKAINKDTVSTPYSPVVSIKPESTTSIGESRPAFRFPNQFFLIPTLLSEQTTTRRNNWNAGVSTIKAGVIFNLLEPLTITNLGTEIDGYFFLDVKHIMNMLTLKSYPISVDANYDMGIFGETKLLPFTTSFDYNLRGIADNDEFFDEIEGATAYLPYNALIQNLNLQLSLTKGERRTITGLHLLGGLNRYDVNIQDQISIKYNLNKGFRTGAMATYSHVKSEAKSNISPCGFAAKLQYDFWNQLSLKDENSIVYPESSSIPKEQYYKYKYHQILGHMKTGLSAPWYNRHDIYLDLQGTLLSVVHQDTTFPSFLLPGVWVPGYSYYYRDTKIKRDSISVTYDTLQVTGKAVLSGTISYRFPLWPGLIDKKLSFLYLERLYGAINVSGGAG
ncbi:MAG: hypothetical protein GX640_14125, partial [Fibrobacter sp.]|nr:hypothetical protein [Fibrobacter sp.]